MSVPDECFSRNAPCALNQISTVLLDDNHSLSRVVVTAMLHSGSAILQVAVAGCRLQVAGCGLQVAGHKYKMSPVAMHTLKLIVVYYS